MDTTLLHKGEEHKEEENKKKGFIASAIIHLILIALAIIPFFTYPDPPPESAGILISFGEPEVGQGEEEPAPASKPIELEEVDEPEPEKEEVVEREVEEVKEEKPKAEKPKPVDTKKVNTDDNSKEIALKKKKEKEKRAKEAAEQAKADAIAKEKKRKADAAAKEKKRLADIEAKKKADFDKAKSDIGDLFNKDNGQGTGTGSQGTSGTDGNAGDPDGNPDASKLDGIGKGKGDVNGFGNRGFQRPSPISGKFSEVGTVNLEVCVDGDGKVLSAKPKLSGSTTQNSKLQQLAKENALKYRFDKSGVDKQCGTITYKFQLQ